MVSVIVPVFNGAPYIAACLQSILAQSYDNLEVIVIDDGSRDKTCEICSRIQATDSRVRLIRQANAGVSVARNRGIEAAAGKYITFVDADDLLPPDALQVMVQALCQGCDLVVGSHEEFRTADAVPHLKTAQTVTKAAFFGNALQHEKLLHAAWGKLFKADLIRAGQVRFVEKLPMFEDTLFTWSYYKHAQSMQVISDVVYRYRLGGIASTVKYYPERNHYFLKAFAAYFDFFGGEEQTPGDFLRDKITGGLLDCCNHYLCHCGKAEATAKIGQTLRLFGPYISEDTIDPQRCGQTVAAAILAGDEKKIASVLRKKMLRAILIKRIKRMSYGLLRHRI